MDDPIKDGIGERRFSDLFIPTARFKLRTENSGGVLVPRFDDFQHITRVSTNDKRKRHYHQHVPQRKLL